MGGNITTGGAFSTTGRIYPGTGSALQATGYITCESDGDFVFTGGKLGIGVSPTYQLDVYSATAGMATAMNVRNAENSGSMYAISASADGVGGTLHVAGSFTASGATTNLAVHLAAGQLRIDGQASTGANVPTIGTNKPGSAVALTPNKWLTVNLDGTDHYIPCWI